MEDKNLQIIIDTEDDSDDDSDETFEKKDISVEDWNQMFKKGKFKKQDMDKLVMSFLLNKGLLVAAETFHSESGCPMEIDDVNHLGTQLIVKDLLSKRRYDTAIDVLNENLGKSFLKRRKLHYRLVRQQMIELCRAGDFEAADEFAPRFSVWVCYGPFKQNCFTTTHLLFNGFRGTRVLPSYLKEFLKNFDDEKVIKKMSNFKDNSIDKAIKTLKAVEHDLNKVAEFPNFDFVSGYPEPLPHSDSDLEDSY